MPYLVEVYDYSFTSILYMNLKSKIEIEMTDEKKELEKQADELLKNANQ